MPRKPPVIKFLPTGQPMVRTGRGPRFGKTGQKTGPFENAGTKITMGMADGLAIVAQNIMEQSLYECPVDTGALKASARFELAQVVTGDIKVQMGYGFGSEVNPKTRRLVSDYAVPVHEILEARHAPPTKAKFLEDPLLEHAHTIEPFLAANIRASLAATGKGAFSMEDIVGGAIFSFEEK